ncbi:DUF2251 domain-containing protein [Gallibacterium salpingitidis]|uniref:DUF2251 domain-containing protein n=1 Tax=Gallibacterium salpingitidis TaxID=505341 RepID=A0A1A7NYL9_9PAST|nr:DUF2251 domain-containing protein [Gallibacterium salpingitidis]OBW94586.1 hypothetical protein QS62_05990 [Gallibacterium salpingitidis]
MLHLTLEDQLFISQPKQLGTHSSQHENLAVVFEDDGETGYFYAIDTQQEEAIVDCLHIYNAASVEQKETARQLQICWSEDGYFAILLINDYPHAAFDFKRLIAYNHNQFPQPAITSLWSHKLITDELIKQWLTDAENDCTRQ